MRRIAIFAHYDKNAVIEQYVEYNIQQLRKIADFIIFVSDSDLNEKETEKILKYTNHNIIGHHGEYDFGSYKRGFQYALENNLLDQFEELIFVNDSCYAPLFPYEKLFAAMQDKSIDFWGITANKDYYFKPIYHVQSYFLVFSKQVFKSKVFNNFIESIKKEESKKDIVKKYEYGLTHFLEKANFKWDVYCQSTKHNWNSTILHYENLILKEQCPILKRNIFMNKIECLYNINKVQTLIQKHTQYDFELIQNDITKNKLTFDYKSYFKHLQRYTMFYLIKIHDFLTQVF